MQLHFQYVAECQEVGDWISQCTVLNPPVLSRPTWNTKPQKISKIHVQKQQCPQDTKCWYMQYAHTNQQRTKMSRIQVKVIKGEKKEKSCWFGLYVMGEVFFPACRGNCMWWKCGPCEYLTGKGTLHGAVTVGHGIWWDYSSVMDRQGQSVILAMYTFVVGPWLPQASVISSGLIRKPGEIGRKNLRQSNHILFV